MTGLIILNNDGAEVINSDHRHTVFDSSLSGWSVRDYGSTAAFSTPFGNSSSLGFIYAPSISDLGYLNRAGYICWMRLNSGAWGMPGAKMMNGTGFQLLLTRWNYNLQSGYLDVFDSSGRLIWSAVGSSDMPRIIDTIEVPANYNLQGSVYSKSLSFNPWFPIAATPGGIDILEDITTFSGACVRWTGSQLQLYWAKDNYNTPGYSAIYGGRGGLRFPLAYFKGR